MLLRHRQWDYGLLNKEEIMKAIRVDKPYDINIVEIEKPQIKSPNEVLVRVRAAGICGSDMHIYRGTNPFAKYPRVIGHEIVGEVAEVGDEVTDIKVGDRVQVEPIEYCGECYACKSGRGNVCQNLHVLGVHKDGGFQEYITVQSDKIHILPDSISFVNAVMIEPFTIGAQVCYRGDVKKDDVVLIFGAGPTGLSAMENAIIKGATVIIVDIDDTKLEYAKEFGANVTLNSSKIDVEEEVRKLTDGMMPNVVVDAVGNAKILSDAIKLVSVAGRVVCLGFVSDLAEVSLVEMTKKEVTLAGSRLQTNQFKNVIDIFANHDVNTTKLITHVMEYTDIKEAINLIEDPNVEVGKVVLTFS